MATVNMEHYLPWMHNSNLITIDLEIHTHTHIYYGFDAVCLLDGSYIGLQKLWLWLPNAFQFN